MKAPILDLIEMILTVFLSTSCPNTSYQVSSHLAFWFRRRISNTFSQMVAISDYRSELLLLSGFLILPTTFGLFCGLGGEGAI